MEESEYPTLTDGELPQLTIRQHIMVAIEGSPVLTVIFVLWFVGVAGTMLMSYFEGTPRLVIIAIIFVFFVTSAIMFLRLLKNGYLEKPRYNTERYFLRRMGVKKPMKFLKEHPLHLSAYVELSKDLADTSNREYTRAGIGMIFMPAMLVFTGPDRYTSGPLILSIMEERQIRDTASIAGILNEVEHNPPVLNEGAL
jgi:hypothetical protein